MKRRLPRELFWMIVPVLLLGGGVWLLPVLRQLRGGPPVGIEKGIPRLVTANWHLLNPRAVDYARGLSSSIEVDAWSGGQCPALSGPMTNEGFDFPQGLRFAFLRNGKWESQPIEYGSSGMDWWATSQNYSANPNFSWGQSKNTTKDQREGEHIEMHLPMDQVPHDAMEVRLQGRLDGYMWCRNIPPLRTYSQPIDVVLKSPSEAWPVFKGSRQPALQFLRSTQMPIIDPSNHDPYKPTVEVNALFKPRDSNDTDIWVSRSWITDANKKFVFGLMSMQNPDKTTAQWRFNTLNFQGKAPFTLNAWVSVSFDKWPLLARIPLKVKPSKSSR